MISYNIVNILSLMLITVLAIALAKWALRAAGMDTSWL